MIMNLKRFGFLIVTSILGAFIATQFHLGFGFVLVVSALNGITCSILFPFKEDEADETVSNAAGKDTDNAAK